MALEAVVFPQEHLACNTKALFTLDYGIDEFEEKRGVVLQEHGAELHGTVRDSTGCSIVHSPEEWEEKLPVSPQAVTAAAAGRRGRRRAKVAKNREEVENQRRNHIAVERNRRRQMNEYLAVLRSLMPASYARRGDQASIVGGAINFVKELEQLLQSLEAQKRSANLSEANAPFADFFVFPQYSRRASAAATGAACSGNEVAGGTRSAVADIEVTMAESHANLKVLAQRRPKQLFKMVVGLQSLGLTVLHLNVTTAVDEMVLYSFSLKMAEDCQLSSVDEVGTAVHQLVVKIAEECVS